MTKDTGPPICEDIRLHDWYEGGVTRITGKKRQRLLEKAHELCHREHTAHINLDGTYDTGKGDAWKQGLV